MSAKASAQSKSSRLFKNDLLEAATHVHPITPLVLWGPVVAYLVYWSLARLGAGETALWAVLGLLVWTLSEYSLHRIVFHYEAKGRFGKYMVYLFHGIHHDEPSDATRLVMPPVPAIAIASLFYFLFATVVGPVRAKPLFAFFIVGYLCYDYIHYATHHFKCQGPVLKFLKRHHMLHHHLMSEGNFGVSSPLWDLILGTFHKNVSRKPAS